jgi:hypothetical protein
LDHDIFAEEIGNPVNGGFFEEAKAQPAFVPKDRSFDIECTALLDTAIFENNREGV